MLGFLSLQASCPELANNRAMVMGFCSDSESCANNPPLHLCESLRCGERGQFRFVSDQLEAQNGCVDLILAKNIKKNVYMEKFLLSCQPYQLFVTFLPKKQCLSQQQSQTAPTVDCVK